MFSATTILFVTFYLLNVINSSDVHLYENHDYVIPNIVHQVYDYQSPSYFLYLSIKSIQYHIKPEKHYLWVNKEGRFRMNNWYNWYENPSTEIWINDLKSLINQTKIEPMFIDFPSHPPNNLSTYVSNTAHRSDFVRLQALIEYGGIYLDTDAFVMSNKIHLLRIHDVVMTYDNAVKGNKHMKLIYRLNNGVILSIKNSTFLSIWLDKYKNFNPNSWFHDSSVVPFNIAMHYPDLIHIEMNRLSPISYGFQTSAVAYYITCGIFNPINYTIWYPRYDINKKIYTYIDSSPDKTLYYKINKKLVLHLTMTKERGYNMMRVNMSPTILSSMHSLLGHYFRLIVNNGIDNFNYQSINEMNPSDKLIQWDSCKNSLGMYYDFANIDLELGRQQYID